MGRRNLNMSSFLEALLFRYLFDAGPKNTCVLLEFFWFVLLSTLKNYSQDHANSGVNYKIAIDDGYN